MKYPVWPDGTNWLRHPDFLGFALLQDFPLNAHFFLGDSAANTYPCDILFPMIILLFFACLSWMYFVVITQISDFCTIWIIHGTEITGEGKRFQLPWRIERIWSRFGQMVAEVAGRTEAHLLKWAGLGRLMRFSILPSKMSWMAISSSPSKGLTSITSLGLIRNLLPSDLMMRR
jgi:hypothetical protein